ncbi:glycosyltransferase family 2 protein [Campylobacter sputorum]|uniref:glycosyltransferase family 2 protein n=1 Tax=Campylobacter sputorum TaxID=206 RepID=UPI0018965339|nr:glycosyltransferase family 2 protein [Campylobacter sp. RM11259]MBF6677315.1 glycosyltransferase [Campylobacter sp. RM11259]
MQNNPLISIIVPVYNVENFIEKCATTLFEQDYDNIEYIFVNECTPYNSIEVLNNTIKKYPNRKKSIKIINNIKNQGSSLSRKIGLDIANGEYILFVDSDDWVELDMVSSLVKEAIKTDADIICFDYFINFPIKEIKKKYLNRHYENNIEMLKDLLSGYINGFLGTKFAKMEIYKKIKFPNFQYLEDVYLTTQLFYYANNIKYLNKNLYHYNQINLNSITKQGLNNKAINNWREFYKTLTCFLKESDLENFKIHINIMMAFIIIANSNGNSKKLFDTIRPSANSIKYIWKNKSLNLIKKNSIFSAIFALGVAICDN